MQFHNMQNIRLATQPLAASTSLMQLAPQPLAASTSLMQLAPQPHATSTTATCTVHFTAAGVIDPALLLHMHCPLFCGE